MAPQFPFPLGVASTVISSAVTAPTATPSSSISMMPNVAGQQAAAMAGGGIPMIDLTKINPYIYLPSFSMAVVGSMAFLITAIIHTFQLFKTRAWYFGVMQNGTLVAAASLIARANSVVNLSSTGATGPFIVFMVLDMAGGSLANIGTVFTYTRIVWWVTPDEKRTLRTLWSPPGWMSIFWGLLLFVGDATRTVAQNVFKPNDPTSLKIQTTAQIYQFFVMSAFTFVTYRFMAISSRWTISGECEDKNWRQLGKTVVLAAFILSLRMIFTVVQLDARADPTGFYSQHEWVYWATQSIPLFVVFILYNLMYPGNFLPREYIGFRLSLRKIKKAKRDASWPLTISPPIPTKRIERVDDKHYEVKIVAMGDRY